MRSLSSSPERSIFAKASCPVDSVCIYAEPARRGARPRMVNYPCVRANAILSSIADIAINLKIWFLCELGPASARELSPH